MLTDSLHKFLFEDFPIKGSIVHLHSSWSEICSKARPLPQYRHMLAEAVCASVLLTSNIKFSGSVSLQIQSGGALGLLVAQCTEKHEVRGVIRGASDSDEAMMHKPLLSINLEPADGGVPYSGMVSLHEDGLARALEQYFEQSEQLETRFWLATGEHCCSGFMLQRMPGQSLDSDAWNRVLALASTISNQELLDLEASNLLRHLFSQENLRIFKPASVRFGCRCSVARVSSMLKSLGESEVQSIIKERGTVEVSCEYCGQTYKFDRIDVIQLFGPGQIMVSDMPGTQ